MDSIERLLEIARVLRQRVDGMSISMGVTPAGMRILRLLERRVCASTSEVAGLLNLLEEAVSRELPKLIAGGYISRDKVGRTNRLKITMEGSQKVRDFRECLVRLNRQLLPDVHLADFHVAMVKIESRMNITVTHAEGKPAVRKRKGKNIAS
jgi:DNA-binding MarR family transcriptional regulator